MKVFIFTLLFILLGLTAARVPGNAVSKCEDILSEKICATLRQTAQEVRQKIEVIDHLVVKAVKEHFKDAEAIVHKVRQQLAKMAKNLKCEDVLSQSTCTKLRAAAEALKQKAKVVDEIVRRVVKEKVTKAKEIVKRVQEKLVTMAKNFKCEDVLSEKLCAKIREVAIKVEVKVTEVEKTIKQLVAKGITQAKQIIEKIRERLFPANEIEFMDLTTITKCEDVLSAEVCGKLRAAAEALKQKAKVVDEIVRRVVKEKVTEAKEIVKRVQEKLVTMAKNFKCEDVLSEKLCAKIREVAIKVEVKVTEVEKTIKQLVAKGITQAKQIIEKIRERLLPANEIEFMDLTTITKCEDVLSTEVCGKLRAAAEALKQKAKVVDEIVRRVIKEKVTEAKEIVKRVQEKLVTLAKNFKCEDVLSEKLCAKIREVAIKVEVKVTEVEKTIKQLVAKGIIQAKQIIEKIRERLFPANEIEFMDLTTITKCEDVLSAEVCGKLRAAAEALKQKAKVVDEIVRRVVKEKVTEAKEIVKRVQEKLVTMAKNFKCEDVLSEKLCAKIREVAIKVEVKVTEVEKTIKQLVAKGITQAKQIIEKIRERLFPANEIEFMDLTTITKCEDVLSAEVCGKLRAAADALKQKAKVIDEIVRRVVKEKVTEAKEIVKRVQEILVTLAKNFKCENVLSEKLCAKIREVAIKVEVKVTEVEKTIKQLVAKGITQAKQIIEKIRERLFPANVIEFMDLTTITKCEDVLSAEVCGKLRAAAEALKQKAKVVDEIVRRVVKEKVTEAKEIVKRVQEKLVTMAKNFKCEDVLSEKFCAKIREVAIKVEVKVTEVEKTIKQLVAKGITQAKQIIEKIRERLFPANEIEFMDLTTITKCEDVLSAEVCGKLRAAAEALKQKAKVVDEIVRRVVKEKVTEAKEIVKRVQEKLVTMAKNFKCEDVLSEKLCAKIREVAIKVEVKFTEVEKTIKQLVAKGITQAKQIIEKIRERLSPANEIEFMDLTTITKCEDVLSAEVCGKLRAAAEALKQKAKVVDEIVRRVVKEKVTEAKEIVKRVQEKLVTMAKNFKCEDVLSEKVCAKIRDFASKVEVKVAVIEEQMKELVAKGITEAKKILEKVRGKLFPAFEEDDLWFL